jgi:hypothetical protein
MCDKTEASCRCVNEECDGRTHTCKCGGGWTTDENGQTDGYTSFPGGFSDPWESISWAFANAGKFEWED